eukprot:TRINITY_DN3369_c0_g1_i1.p1 TRINITY_DN3369_c0_g1~~TRINITY_DN3369_c0_g1_i1.p1  ORF type:complete len:294 (-),score=53.61 TRINITY_DN3369_c0_g1_i1:157-1038(-)
MGTMSEPPAWLDPQILEAKQIALLGLLRATVERLDKASVPYWITGGTLLGALRHRGFIPHDDDVDLECFESDLTKIKTAFDHHDLLYFRMGGRWNSTAVGHVGLRRQPSEEAEIELDIFLREEPLEELKDFPSAAEVFPLKTLCFHEVKVGAPQSPETYLIRLYGQDWDKTVRVWSHDFNPFHSLAHNPDKVTVSLEDYTEQILSAGYKYPRLPAAETVEETLRVLASPGGILENIKTFRDETWLDKLKRRNREQAEARLRLEEELQARIQQANSKDEAKAEHDEMPSRSSRS